MAGDKNLQTIYRLYQEVWNQKKLHVIDEIFADDFAIHAADLTLSDKGTLKKFIKSWLDAFPDIHHEINDVISLENRLALRFHGKGTHQGPFLHIAPSNKPFSYTGMNFVYFENAKIKTLYLNSDMYELIHQLTH